MNATRNAASDTGVPTLPSRPRLAWQLGPLGCARAAVRAGYRRRRQFGLSADVGDGPPVSIPDSGPLEPTDGSSFSGFTDLEGTLEPGSLLEVLWYQRFAATGARTLLVARDEGGCPTFSTWMLDAEGQQAHYDRFGEAFHQLEDGEMLMEGIFTFPAFRRRHIATAGIAAACRWAAEHGARTLWCYPYADNPAIFPALQASGFRPVHARVETAVLGRLEARHVSLTAADIRAWTSRH
jgi:GNAT superfamily N-acetyltransferase